MSIFLRIMYRPDPFFRAALIIWYSIAGASVLGGCAQQAVLPPTVRHPAAHSMSSPRPAPVLSLLSYAQHLAKTTSAGRESAVRAARHQVRDDPSAMSYARLALALGSPRQHLYTPDEAARYAKLALASEPSPWGTEARQYLSDYARLYGKLSDSESDEDSEQQRIVDLRKRLSKARKKLQALSNLENRLDNVENNP